MEYNSDIFLLNQLILRVFSYLCMVFCHLLTKNYLLNYYFV